ncbi:MAG: Undecaprenyl-phosphate galactose phosphotransferase, WbaP/exopolysaccharide biosynthesis polyprenyl [Ignavibacteria bacterium]|nr:Undecaprenyl-phosphate galactose phosphotransferase, WbaP/exopolysaccharide biosynthesis polyprenyl [Ignavibacteria bacterium]
METLTLNQVSSSVLTARTTSTESIGFKTHSAYSTLIFLAVDLLAFVIAISIAKSLIHFVYGDVIISLETSLHILSSIAIAPVVIGFFGLYPGYGIGAVDELKKVTYSVFVAFSLILTLTFYFSFSSDITKIFISVSWLIAHVALPVSRVSTRHLLSQTEWWGLPVAIIGAGALGEKIIKKMKTDKNLGIRPVVAFDNDSDRWGYLDGLPVVGNLEVSGKISKKLNITSAILTLENENELHYLSTIKLIMKNFKRVIITSGEHYYGNVWPKVCNLSGIIGLVSQNKLLHPLSYIYLKEFSIFYFLLS